VGGVGRVHFGQREGSTWVTVRRGARYRVGGGEERCALVGAGAVGYSHFIHVGRMWTTLVLARVRRRRILGRGDACTHQRGGSREPLGQGHAGHVGGAWHSNSGRRGTKKRPAVAFSVGPRRGGRAWRRVGTLRAGASGVQTS